MEYVVTFKLTHCVKYPDHCPFCIVSYPDNQIFCRYPGEPDRTLAEIVPKTVLSRILEVINETLTAPDLPEAKPFIPLSTLFDRPLMSLLHGNWHTPDVIIPEECPIVRRTKREETKGLEVPNAN